MTLRSVVVTIPHTSLILALASCGAMLVAAGPALAQDALGGGNALDSNLGVGTGGRNPGRAANPYAGRNSVVTGEVIGGREFRGRVGYTGPSDFRGVTGSNELFRFQAQSAWSSPSMISLGSSTYDQLRFGEGLGAVSLRRATEGATPGEIIAAPGPVDFSHTASSRFRVDNATLSALSSAIQERQVEPSMLRTAFNQQGEAVAITASSVRGLTLEQYDETLSNLGLSTYDLVRVREESRGALPGGMPGNIPGTPPQPAPGAQRETGATEARPRIGATFQTRFEHLRTDAAATDTVADTQRVDASLQTDYTRVLQRIADRYVRANADDRNLDIQPALLQNLDRQYQALRQQLTGEAGTPSIDPATGQPRAERGTSGAPTSSRLPAGVESGTSPGMPTLPRAGEARPGEPRDPRTRDPQQPPPPQRPSDADPRDPTAPPQQPGEIPGMQPPTGDRVQPIDPSRLGPVLRHGQKIERLSSAEQGRFNELMLAAEEQLRAGDYLAAEQRFQRALRFAPGHPLAMAGAANAQVGAGLYLAAAVTLRVLFTEHPEMIDVTYGEGVLPTRERLDEAVATLRTRLEAASDRGALSFLLAYIGRQIGDRAMIEEGLRLMSEASADDRLVPLLRTVWLEATANPEK